MPKHGKNFVNAQKQVDKNKFYILDEAIVLAKKTSTVKFDATVEVAYRLNVDPRQADQNIRGALVLPNGTGKTKKVLVFAKGDKAKEAEAAGADFVGDAELIDKIAKGWFDFDVAIATPDMMAGIGKIGRLLGPKGLMPNPKTGTVTMDVTQAVNDFKSGKLEYRVDKAGNVSLPVGKVSFTEEKLAENIMAVHETLVKVKPASAKGKYIKNISVATTMGPGVRVDIDSMG